MSTVEIGHQADSAPDRVLPDCGRVMESLLTQGVYLFLIDDQSEWISQCDNLAREISATLSRRVQIDRVDCYLQISLIDWPANHHERRLLHAQLHAAVAALTTDFDQDSCPEQAQRTKHHRAKL